MTSNLYVFSNLKLQLVSVFNVTSAWSFVNDHLGIDYGWEVVLMGLLDTPTGNEICVDSQKVVDMGCSFLIKA